MSEGGKKIFLEKSVVFLESGRLDEILFDFQPFAGKITEFGLRKILPVGRAVVVLQGSDKFLFERIEIFSGDFDVQSLFCVRALRTRRPFGGDRGR